MVATKKKNTKQYTKQNTKKKNTLNKKRTKNHLSHLSTDDNP